jgi:hypothetical protein
MFTTRRPSIHHAASLRHTFVHCGRFSTAASRRSMASVSVPLVGVRLSPPLRVIALVVLYTTNKLIRGRPIQKRRNFTPKRLSGIIPPFDGLCLTSGYVPTCYYPVRRGSKPSRLACLIHAASIHPELGSNSN